MLETSRELIDQFNKHEQRRRRLQRQKRARRKQLRGARPELLKCLDRLDEITEDQKPVDCVSSKWIK